jgi:hypothetical protein
MVMRHSAVGGLHDCGQSGIAPAEAGIASHPSATLAQLSPFNP